MRDGASSYIGADADGNPSGFARLPTFFAGEVPNRFPVQCAHCREVLRKLAEFQTHNAQ